MELDTPQFTSKDDEIQYWMELAQQMFQRLLFLATLRVIHVIYL